MREILFRGRIKKSKSEHEELNWVSGNLVKELETGRCFISDLSHFDNNTKLADVILEVDPETVCQYTGLTDKNGRRYEGDIFQASDGDHIQRYIIAWDGDSLAWSAECISDSEGTLPLSEFRVSEIEVIGNIFDNPELIVS